MPTSGCVVILGILLIPLGHPVAGSDHAQDLFVYLLKDYQKYVRPSYNMSHPVNVTLQLQLIQIINVNEVNQVITTNVNLGQRWQDYRLKWKPEDYGGIVSVSIPSQEVWVPDVCLYNNAEGDYQITKPSTKVTVMYTGGVYWNPPAIYKSYCAINVRYFPYDQQSCNMTFSSWTYDMTMVPVYPSKGFVENEKTIEVGMDLSEYKCSGEWDILEASVSRWQQKWEYGPWCGMTYQLVIRRKSLFYTVNIVIPCVLISFLTVFVFYLPCDSGEKVTLCISILLSLTVFILTLAKIIPPTSENVPLLGRYLLFTLIMTCLSIALAVIVINVNLRTTATHSMRPCVRTVLLTWLPKILRVERPLLTENEIHGKMPPSLFNSSLQTAYRASIRLHEVDQLRSALKQEKFKNNADLQNALNGVEFIRAHLKQTSRDAATVRDWKYAARVLDRLFFIMFAVGCVVGSGVILLDAPPLWASVPTLPKPCPDPKTADPWVCLSKVEGENSICAV